MESELLQYLQDWEDSARTADDLGASEQNKMLLSIPTLEGIRITGWSGADAGGGFGGLKPPPFFKTTFELEVALVSRYRQNTAHQV